MSRSRSNIPKPPAGPDRAGAPQAALDALLGGAAGDPIRRALWLDALDLRLRPCLPPSLAAHVRLANVDGAKLVFLVDSPVWHARLRLAATELLDSARSIGLDVAVLVIKTTRQSMGLPGQASPTATAPATHLSAAARDAMQAALASFDGAAPGRGAPVKKDGS